MQNGAYAQRPNCLVKPTPTSSACGFPACFALRCGLPLALGLPKKPVFMGVLGLLSVGSRQNIGSCDHMPRPNGPPVLWQSCGPDVVIGLSVGMAKSQDEGRLDCGLRQRMAGAIRKGRRHGNVVGSGCHCSTSRTPGCRLVCGLAGLASVVLPPA